VPFLEEGCFYVQYYVQYMAPGILLLTTGLSYNTPLEKAKFASLFLFFILSHFALLAGMRHNDHRGLSRLPLVAVIL
jgi:hypothetical protein